MDKVIAAFVGVMLMGREASAGDPIPFFTPDPKPVMYGPPLPDPEVPECAANDRACLEAHDAAALSAALAAEDAARCEGSRTPAACRAAYEMITGNVGMKADPILDDPCSWVVLVDHGIATIESRRTGARHRYVDRGWKPLTFLGKCDLSKVSSRGGEVNTPLPTWVVRRAAPAGGGASPRASRATSPGPGPAPSVMSPSLPPAGAAVTEMGQRPVAGAAQPTPMPTMFAPVSTIKP